MTPLVPHPTTPEPGFGVAAGAERLGDRVRFAYRLVGAIERVRVPAAAVPRRGDRLWEHTCFEAFVAPDGGEAYVELNVAPSGAWAVYGFTRYREPDAVAPAIVPAIGVTRGDESLDVEATLPCAPGPLRVGLTAVVERSDGSRSYWALRHPAAVPDFHHAGGFALRLA
jgi:hypothetical protein